MSSTSLSSGATGRDKARAWRIARVLAPLAAIVVFAVVAQTHWLVNSDTSWNITLAEKVLDGQRPNIDFFEINPPLSFLLYLPPTLAGRLTGASPEFMVDLFCFACAGLSLWLCGRILVRSDVFAPFVGARFVVVAAAALLLLPARAFNEREHIAMMLALPCLAALAVWATRGCIDPLLSLCAGLGAGVAMAIKPHFALFFLPNVAYLVRRAGWRVLIRRIELWAALATAALCWGAMALWCPSFFERVAPIARDIYLPYRRPLAMLSHDPTFLTWAALGVLLGFAARKRWTEPLVAVPALASLGAVAAYLIQGKLWPYQGYPAVALVALALVPLALDGLARTDQARSAFVGMTIAICSALVLSFAGLWFALGGDKPDLERAVAAIAPHPKILAISPDIATGHPLTRRVHGVWVGSLMSLWITQMSDAALQRNPSADDARRYQAYLLFDRRTLAADIVDKRPDAILIPNETWLAWALGQTEIALALADYHLRETADGVMVYARNDSGR